METSFLVASVPIAFGVLADKALVIGKISSQKATNRQSLYCLLSEILLLGLLNTNVVYSYEYEVLQDNIGLTEQQFSGFPGFLLK